MIYTVLFTGKSIAYSPENLTMDMGIRFGFIKNTDEQIQISNRIFETRLYNYYLSEEMLQSNIYTAALQINVGVFERVRDGKILIEAVV